MDKFGFTVGCADCRAAGRGSTAVKHTEECRKGIIGELEKAGDETIERETESFFEYLEEEEKKKRKMKAKTER